MSGNDQKFDAAKIGLMMGPAVFILLGFVASIPGLDPVGSKVLGLSLWMAIWWATEAIPIPVTALLPICLLPWIGSTPIRETTEAYGHPLIYLFLGGFMLALAMERSGLHRRFALLILIPMAGSASRLVFGFMLVAALLSMWVTNTATAMMMTPIGMSVIGLVNAQTKNDKDRHSFATALLLGIAYAATIGGLGTLVGTVPNTLLAGFINDQLQVKISFANWMLVGVPLVILFVPLCWLLLIKVFPLSAVTLKGSESLLKSLLAKEGKMRVDERRVMIIFIGTALAWMFRPLLQAHVIPQVPLSDTGIAITAGIALFIVPRGEGSASGLLNWETARKLPWDLLLMFGGGLALADAIRTSGVSEWLGNSISALQVAHVLILIVVITTLTIFVTELTSNTATTATFLPIILSVAQGLQAEPILLLVPTAIAASCAFMLPVATPPNAVVYGSGEVQIKDMIRAGFWLNLLAILLVSLACYLLVPWALLP